ncbi:MAG: YbaN family protein [Actinomycetota bacterium]
MAPNRLVKYTLIFVGSLFVGLGVVGIFVPLLPTTPFLLVAAALYAKASEKFYRWLMENRMFGSYIKDYRQKKGMSLKTKIGTISILWITIAASAVFAADIYWVRVLLLVIAMGVTIHLWLLNTLKK